MICFYFLLPDFWTDREENTCPKWLNYNTNTKTNKNININKNKFVNTNNNKNINTNKNYNIKNYNKNNNKFVKINKTSHSVLQHKHSLSDKIILLTPKKSHMLWHF